MKRLERLDNGFRNLSNNMAFELFYGGTASRGIVGTTPSVSGTTLTFTLQTRKQVVQFEVGMSLQGTATDGGAALTGSGATVLVAQVTGVNRGTGQITAVVIQDTYSTTWPIGTYLQVYGDIGTAGASTIAGMLGLSGMAAWVPRRTRLRQTISGVSIARLIRPVLVACATTRVLRRFRKA